MKLRNKKTGEIGKLSVYTDGHVSVDDVTSPWSENTIKNYNSLAELNEEWEDVPEEPKEYWFIDTYSYEVSYLEERRNEDLDNFNKEIGNYFETKEEAEIAVEKLKALTEAKEDGLKIKGYYYNHEDLVILADIGKCNKLTLDTLFGKEID